MRFIFILATLLSISYCLYGQSKNDGELFPSYKQLKPASSEIIDYLPRYGKAAFFEKKIISMLFDYPDGTVTYILNDKTMTDRKRATEIVSQNENHIDNISIGEPTSDGKRIIRINYSTKK